MQQLARLAWLVLGICLVTGCTAASRATGHVRPSLCTAIDARSPNIFFAVMTSANGAVEAVSASTGKPLCEVAPGERDGLVVSGVSGTSHGSLLVTYSRGPACSSGIAGCGPKAHTCGAEVVQITLANAHSAVIWRAGRDELLRDAALSPDGTTLVARASVCVPSYFNDHLLVRRVSTGRSWSIGAGVPRCHWIGTPEWTPDGRHVLITYAAPHSKKPYSGPDGTCSEFGDSSLVRVDATHASRHITGDVVPPRPSCTWSGASVTATATYAIEACGREPSRLDGGASLVQLNGALRKVRHWSIGQCTDGNSLAADAVRGVVVSAYLFCNPPPKGQKLRDPVTVLDHLNGGRLLRVGSMGGGFTAWDDLSW